MGNYNKGQNNYTENALGVIWIYDGVCMFTNVQIMYIMKV